MPETDRDDLKKWAEELFDKGHGDLVGGRTVIAVGHGLYRYGRTVHKSVDCPKIMKAGKEIARRAGIQTNFTHALIAATPAHRDGGIGTHTDRECVPGSPLLAVGLDGRRKVLFDFPGHGTTQVEGDYLALSGLHTRVEHRVVTTSYTLGIIWRVQKPANSRSLNGVLTPRSCPK